MYPPSFSRALHTCHTTDTNQMIMVGGVDPSNDTGFTGAADAGLEPMDPWPEGIGIFDMTYLKFKDFYETNAKQYETPEPIKRFYNDTSNRIQLRGPHSAVKELFQTKFNQTSNLTASETPAPKNSSIAQPTKNSQRPPSHISSASIAGIAISVAIVVVALCAIAILTVKGRATKAKFQTQIFTGELPVDERHHELSASAKLPELLDEREERPQLANTGIIELFDPSRRDRVELP